MDSAFEVKTAEALRELRGPSKISLRAAEKKYGVPRSTLTRRLEGGISKRKARCVQQILSLEQEDLLVQRVLTLETEGHVLTHGTV
jgi:helix-turn-helix, Psq domain